MSFRSPSGGKAIEIWQTAVDNSWGARVELVAAGKETVLYKVPREALIYFVHVYWSPDEARVGVVVTGFTILHLACDTKTGELIPFAQIQADVGKSLERTYRIPPGEDPIQWAAMADAQIEFFRLHPEVRLSYR